SLLQHKNNFPAHHICRDCSIDFGSSLGLIQHYVQSRRHNHCQSCDTYFDNLELLKSHIENNHYHCAVCGSVFQNEQGLQQHSCQKHLSLSYLCIKCRQHFHSQSNLDAHLRSSVHVAAKYYCGCHGCKRAFVSISAHTTH
ncbi:hypothetical protein B0H21DRAFT_697005, partial [Amylocystis lapponica]